MSHDQLSMNITTRIVPERILTVQARISGGIRGVVSNQSPAKLKSGGGD
jgi:hypothetical protein